jgi:hypothetical protein
VYQIYSLPSDRMPKFSPGVGLLECLSSLAIAEGLTPADTRPSVCILSPHRVVQTGPTLTTERGKRPQIQANLVFHHVCGEGGGGWRVITDKARADAPSRLPALLHCILRSSTPHGHTCSKSPSIDIKRRFKAATESANLRLEVTRLLSFSSARTRAR